MTRNDRSEAQMGIFWMLGDGLILDVSPLSETEPYGDFLTHCISHIDFWTEQQRIGALPRDIEYEEAPGRSVILNSETIPSQPFDDNLSGMRRHACYA